MNRAQFEHAVRAAAAVAGEHEVIVIGSQAIHAWIEEEIPEAAMRSVGGRRTSNCAGRSSAGAWYRGTCWRN